VENGIEDLSVNAKKHPSGHFRAVLERFDGTVGSLREVLTVPQYNQKSPLIKTDFF
jgi:hypothetical protein